MSATLCGSIVVKITRAVVGCPVSSMRAPGRSHFRGCRSCTHRPVPLLQRRQHFFQIESFLRIAPHCDARSNPESRPELPPIDAHHSCTPRRASRTDARYKVHLSSFDFDDKMSTSMTSVNPKTKSGVGYFRSRLTEPDDEKLKANKQTNSQLTTLRIYTNIQFTSLPDLHMTHTASLPRSTNFVILLRRILCYPLKQVPCRGCRRRSTARKEHCRLPGTRHSRGSDRHYRSTGCTQLLRTCRPSRRAH